MEPDAAEQLESYVVTEAEWNQLLVSLMPEKPWWRFYMPIGKRAEPMQKLMAHDRALRILAALRTTKEGK